MIGCLQASFYRFHVLERQKLINIDRPSHVGWPALRKPKILWKTTTEIKVSLTEKKVIYFKDDFTFLSKCCILKKIYYKESFIYVKESFIVKQKVFFL